MCGGIARPASYKALSQCGMKSSNGLRGHQRLPHLILVILEPPAGPAGRILCEHRTASTETVAVSLRRCPVSSLETFGLGQCKAELGPQGAVHRLPRDRLGSGAHSFGISGRCWASGICGSSHARSLQAAL